MSDLYSPKLTEYIIGNTQWNINAFEAFANFIAEIPDVNTRDQLASMIVIGKKQNDFLLTFLTSKPKDVKVV